MPLGLLDTIYDQVEALSARVKELEAQVAKLLAERLARPKRRK